MSLIPQLQLARLRGQSLTETGLDITVREELAAHLSEGQAQGVSSELLSLILNRPAREVITQFSSHSSDLSVPGTQTQLIAALHDPSNHELLTSQSLSEGLQMHAEDGHSAPLVHLLGLIAFYHPQHLRTQLRSSVLNLSPGHRHLGRTLISLREPDPRDKPPSGPHECELRRLITGLSPSGVRSGGLRLNPVWYDHWQEAAWHGSAEEPNLRPVEWQSAGIWNTPAAPSERLTRTQEGWLWIRDHIGSAPLPGNLRPLRQADEPELRTRLMIASVPIPARHPHPEMAWQAAALCLPLTDGDLPTESGHWRPVSDVERMNLATQFFPWPSHDAPHHPVRLLRREWLQTSAPTIRDRIKAGLRLAERLTRLSGDEDSELLKEGDPLLMRRP